MKIITKLKEKATVYFTVSCMLLFPFFAFLQNGTNDPTFNIGSGFNGNVLAMAIQADGKIIIGGDFTNYNGTAINRITRLNSDGSIDASFDVGTGANGMIFDIEIQDDGKIVIGGEFSIFHGTALNHIARLNENGSPDPSFTVGTGANQLITTLLIQPDNKIIVCGNFSGYSGYTQNGITRLNADGSVDLGFNTGTGTESVSALAIQTDGKIVIGGNFTSYNGISVNRIARLNPDGTIDESFNVGSGASGSIHSVFLQPNGKIVIGGIFDQYDGNERYRIARLNTDGSLDESFNGGNWPNGPFHSICAQQDGKIVVGGDFNSGANFIARLNTDGTLDPTFDTGLGTNNIVASVGVQSDGKILISGNFTSYNGVARNRIARIHSLTGIPTIVTETVCDSLVLGSEVYTTSGSYDLQLINSEGYDSLLTLELIVLSSQPSILKSHFSLPSLPDTCTGSFNFDIIGTSYFTIILDGNTSGSTDDHYTLNGLCPGVHDLQIVNFCSDTLTCQFVVPVDSNYVFNNPFVDSLAQDSLGVTLEDCIIYYNGIDTAYIDSIWANGNTVNVIWNIVDSNGSNFDTTAYVLNNGNGVYWLQLSVFCPSKALGDYFTVTEAVYIEGLSVGLTNEVETFFQLYPNPTNDLVTITFDGNEAELFVYDTQGKLIQTSTITSGAQVSLKDVETGVYFFELSTESGRVVKRVVKN